MAASEVYYVVLFGDVFEEKLFIVGNDKCAILPNPSGDTFEKILK